uniref:Uncharacterized protein n=1 Tax=Triticum urartu TaxID=4572 RepID=A0A8R7JYX8_TRIUA
MHNYCHVSYHEPFCIFGTNFLLSKTIYSCTFNLNNRLLVINRWCSSIDTKFVSSSVNHC